MLTTEGCYAFAQLCSATFTASDIPHISASNISLFFPNVTFCVMTWSRGQPRDKIPHLINPAVSSRPFIYGLYLIATCGSTVYTYLSFTSRPHQPLLPQVCNTTCEASTYKARASEFSSSIGRLIVKDLFRCKKIDFESPRLGTGIEQVEKDN